MFSEKGWTNTDDKTIFDVYIAMIIFELLPEWNWKNIRQLEDNLFIKLSSKHFLYSNTNHDKEHDVAWNRDRTQKTGTKIHKKVITASEENEKWGKIEVQLCLAVFIKQPFNLADQEEGSGSAAMQGKESPVGSNTQETHQYVGPYRLEKTLGKGQTGGWCMLSPSFLLLFSLSLSLSSSSSSFSSPSPLLQISVAIVIAIDDSHRNV